jgi:hypothetical protein
MTDIGINRTLTSDGPADPLADSAGGDSPAQVRTRRLQSLFVLGGFLFLAFLLGIPAAVAGFSTHFASVGTGDARFFAWSMAWWPHAIVHGLNPLVPKIIWAPVGVNLAWATPVPGLSLLALPLTVTVGPVVAYNVVTLVSPALSAWTAYLLCRQVTKSLWPSVAGGLIFGFSSFVLGRSEAAHLSLGAAFVIPLCVYLFLRLTEGSLNPQRFVLFMSLALILQFLISTEVFLTMTLFGGVAILVAFLLAAKEARDRLTRAIGLTCLPFLITGLVVSPYIYYTFNDAAWGVFPIVRGSTDLVALVLPTKAFLLGGGLASNWSHLGPHSGLFTVATTSYFGAPLLLIAALFVVTSWRRFETKLLTIVLGITLVAALGSVLQVNGAPSLSLPWRVIGKVPYMDKILPGRLMVFVFLVLGIMVALWLASARTRLGMWARWSLVAVAALSLVPNPARLRAPDTVVPAFFSSDLYRKYLTPDETVLPLPYGRGYIMLWQAETRMYFRSAIGYIGHIPTPFNDMPIVHKLLNARLKPADAASLRAFLVAHRVEAILVKETAASQWRRSLAPLGLSSKQAGAMVIYDIPLAKLRDWAKALGR